VVRGSVLCEMLIAVFMAASHVFCSVILCDEGSSHMIYSAFGISI